MEKENKKLRDAKKKEYSDIVRSLALYLKKRDPRVKKWKLQQAELEKEQMEEAKKKRKDPLNTSTGTMGADSVPEWAQITEQDYLAYFKTFHPSEDEESCEPNDDEVSGLDTKGSAEEDVYYSCEACRKSFKSESQWLNHEKSKKHLKEVFQLQKKFRKEEKALRKLGMLPREEPEIDADEEPFEELETEENSDSEIENDQENSDSEVENDKEDSDSEVEIKSSSEVGDSEDRDSATNDSSANDSSSLCFSEPDSDVDLETLLHKLNLEKQEKEKEAQPVQQSTTKKKRRANAKKEIPNNPQDKDQGFQILNPKKELSKQELKMLTCKTCKTLFDSRNALFKHLKTTKHAAFK